MANTVNITIRIDRNLKANAERIFEDMGLNLSTAITVFLKQAVRKGRIPFRIEADPFWNDRNQVRFEEFLKEFEEGKVVIKTTEEMERG